MSSKKRADRKARRIANRNRKVKTRNVNATVEVTLSDRSVVTVKVPLTGEFSVIDNGGTTLLTERKGTYINTVKRGIAVAKKETGTTCTVVSARILLAA
jgi:hypothetical protein